ncbi:MAG: T9SS type A sorting domain-containing protein [Flavobacteriales bacterium]|nr:T9SS type A sorting domain-containing protein [Flavobacteriales bacterium]
MRHCYAVLLFAIPLAQAFAQCTPVECIGQLPAWGGLCQSSFIDGRVGEPYSDAISFHVTTACTPASLFDPTQTTASVRITQINSIAFSLLPNGITGVSDQATYTPPVNGCGAISGTPLEAGVFPATVNMSVNVNVWPFSLSCGGFGPIANPNNPVSFGVQLVILPDPSFIAPAEPMCIADGPAQLVPTGTLGGAFSGPGVSGNTFDPQQAGVGVHEVWYIVSAQEGAATAPATDSLSVLIEVNADCLGDCDAFAGALSGGGQVCFDPEGTALVVTPNGDAVVPPGYEVLYLLTFGLSQTVIDTMAQPMAILTDPGLYHIYALVYDPTTFDLDFVEFWASMQVDEFFSQITLQGACASLSDNPPAHYVEPGFCCDAFAGSLGGVDFIPCLDIGGSVELVGIPDGNAIVPEGYEVIYVLTQGAGLTIVDANNEPVFDATETGLHTIHTLVYDPATLDLSMVEFGVTTGIDLNALLIQGGGIICASLDVAGAAYTVIECAVACDADAGTTNGPGAVICLENGEAILFTSSNGDAVVPDGYIQTYVLTTGPDLVVIDGNGDPEFTVSAIGEYRIHSLVIDPLTFLLQVEPGVTTGLDVLDYFAAEGVCGDLDPLGSELVVDICDGVRNVGAAGFSVYPNPSAGGFFVVPDMEGQVLIEMLDVSGRTAFQQRMTCTQGVAAWVVSDAAPGSYVVRLSKGQERWEQRLVIQP